MSDVSPLPNQRTPTLPHVFVYGSLKKNLENHLLLAAAEYKGRMALSGPYQLLDLNYYPAVVELSPTEATSAGPLSPIIGEVYAVTEEILHSLDILEQHPTYYERKKVSSPSWKAVWCYFLPKAYKDRCEVIQDGVWKPNAAELAWIKARKA